MLAMRTAPVTIVDYKTIPDRNNPDQPSRRNDGSLVEMVVYQVEGEPGPRETVLDPGVNGTRAKVGAKSGLELMTDLQPKAFDGKYGPFVRNVVKDRIVGFAA